MYPYSCHLPRHSNCITNGGVLILSRWPIVDTSYIFYRAAAGEERLASKGAVCSILDTPEGARTLIGTHMQSWKKHEKVRRKQFRELFEWARTFPDTTPTLIVGDFNVDFHGERLDFQNQILQFPILLGSQIHSMSNSNSLRGSDLTASRNGCGADYLRQVCHSTNENMLCQMVYDKPKTEQIECACCEDKLLDYAVIPRDSPGATTLTAQVLRWKSSQYMMFPTWVIGQLVRTTMKTNDLSDHYPVLINWV